MEVFNISEMRLIVKKRKYHFDYATTSTFGNWLRQFFAPKKKKLTTETQYTMLIVYD